MLELKWIDILQCPDCRGMVTYERDCLRCQECARAFQLHGGVPIFLSGPAEAASPIHSSNALGADYEQILREGRDFVLHIGAGATSTKYQRCIEFEHKLFRNTDVVGDAHQLPFRDGTFDRVFAFNVFEHLAEPMKASAEIYRVLKPGGSVAIHTAFLQALHEAPHHYYNATEYGVRRWFAHFEVERCDVSGNFAAGMMVAYLMSSVMNAANAAGVTPEMLSSLSETTLGQWAEFWAERRTPPESFDVLQRLPQSAQSKIAAGFELIARKAR